MHNDSFSAYINAMRVFSAFRGIGCTGPHWEYMPWGNCTAKCGGGTSSRQALCMANASDASVAQTSVCANLPMQEDLLRQCNLSPCEVYSWSAGPWQACSAPCGGKPLEHVQPGSTDCPHITYCREGACQHPDCCILPERVPVCDFTAVIARCAHDQSTCTSCKSG